MRTATSWCMSAWCVTNGRVLGGFVRFDYEGPSYAWCCYGCVGPCSPLGARRPDGSVDGWACDAAARRAVERALEAGEIP
jgi:hypothetical protein